MTDMAKEMTIPLGIVVQKRPGVTRWVKEVWQAVAVLPGAGPADWKIMRQEGEVVEYHAATLPLTLYRTDVEAYRVSLAMEPPTVFVILRPEEDRLLAHTVTASAYEAQDYTDSGEELVEPVPMPPALIGTLRDFCDAHWEDVPFVKRKRDRQRVDLSEDGIGDARIRQTADVYRAPSATKPRSDS